jgi:hypothetical protein
MAAKRGNYEGRKLMITELTEDQVAKMPEYVYKWVKIGLCTDDCDRAKAEHLCNEAYKTVGLEPPKRIYWTNDPIECSELADKLDDKGDHVMRDRIGYQVWCQLKKRVGYQVLYELRERIGYQVFEKAWDQVWYQLQNQLGYHIKYQILGSNDTDFLSCHDYLLNELNIKECEIVTPLMELAKNCGWWASFENVAILQEKPKEIHMKNGKLHCETGPAISYRGDKLKIWALNGELWEVKSAY